jgi:hypothetical protein
MWNKQTKLSWYNNQYLWKLSWNTNMDPKSSSAAILWYTFHPFYMEAVYSAYYNNKHYLKEWLQWITTITMSILRVLTLVYNTQNYCVPPPPETMVSLEFITSVLFHILVSFHFGFTSSLISLWECNCSSKGSLLDLCTSCDLELGRLLFRVTGSLYFGHHLVF